MPHTARRSSRPAQQQEPELQRGDRSVSCCPCGLAAEGPLGPSSPESRKAPAAGAHGCPHRQAALLEAAGRVPGWGPGEMGGAAPTCKPLPRPLPSLSEQGLSSSEGKGQGRGSGACTRAPGSPSGPRCTLGPVYRAGTAGSGDLQDKHSPLSTMGTTAFALECSPTRQRRLHRWWWGRPHISPPRARLHLRTGSRFSA